MAKELEHSVLQENLDRELQELNKRLELKEVKNIVVLIHTLYKHRRCCRQATHSYHSGRRFRFRADSNGILRVT